VILESYQKKFSKNTRSYFNSSNSGCAFSQWKKGILYAEGDLIWIAESDDYCDGDFLENLVPLFFDETILLSYAHSTFVDENGRKLDFTFESYLSDISLDKWSTSYVETAHNEVNRALGKKNSIPNISSAVFRKPGSAFALLNDPDWLRMRVCGDWLFYLYLIRGGRIAYCNDTQNYYRIHQASSSKKTHDQDVYYQEHEKVACTIASLYKVSDDLLNKNHQMIREFYSKTVANPQLSAFSGLFDINKVMQSKKKRTPNVLMGVYAFSFGGGEIFPIRLTNALKETGVSVIIFNGGFEPAHPDVRRMLYPLIPVIDYNHSMDTNEIIKEFGIDIIHTHHASMEHLFASAKPDDVAQAKYVATMHGMYEMMGEDFKSNTRDILKGVDYWFYTTDKNIVPFKEHGIFVPERFSKIDNGMKPPQIHAINLADIGIGQDSYTLCLASRALPDKGWLESIDAIESARELTQKDIHLLLIGEGEVYDLLKSRMLPPYIHLLGYRSNLVDYLAASHAGLIPSYFRGESFPLVLIECFMVGKPVIASRIGEIPNMISVNEHSLGGVLINLRNGKINPEDISSAIVKVIEDRGYYQDCIDAVNFLKKRFDIGRIAGEYLKTYKLILSN
jgi:glycosyltransferase involved in cell wall biosynthesis